MARRIGSVNMGNEEQDKRMARAKEVEDQFKQSNPIDKFVFGLPGRQAAEERVSGRESVVDSFLETMDKPKPEGFMESALRTGEVGLKGLGVGAERIESVLAAPIFEGMDIKNPDLLKNLIGSTASAVRGDKVFEFGDVVTSRLPEVNVGGVDLRESLSKIGGLAASLGAGKGIIDAVDSVFKSGSGTLKQVEKSWEVANKTKSVAGQKIADLFDSTVGQKNLNPVQVGSILKGVPERIIAKIKKNPELYGVAFADEGLELANYTAKNVWKLRMALDDLVTSKTFREGATSALQGAIKNTRTNLQGALKAVDKKIAPLMDEYSTLVDSINKAGDFFLTKGNPVVNKAATAMKSLGDPGKQKIIVDFAKTIPTGEKLLRSIYSLNRNRAIRSSVNLAAKTAIGGAIFSKVMNLGRGSDVRQNLRVGDS